MVPELRDLWRRRAANGGGEDGRSVVGFGWMESRGTWAASIGWDVGDEPRMRNASGIWPLDSSEPAFCPWLKIESENTVIGFAFDWSLNFNLLLLRCSTFSATDTILCKAIRPDTDKDEF